MSTYFSDKTFKFLRALARNNSREWFNDHRKDYEQHLKEPFQRLITDLQPDVHTISEHYRADPRGVGGSRRLHLHRPGIAGRIGHLHAHARGGVGDELGVDGDDSRAVGGGPLGDRVPCPAVEPLQAHPFHAGAASRSLAVTGERLRLENCIWVMTLRVPNGMRERDAGVVRMAAAR